MYHCVPLVFKNVEGRSYIPRYIPMLLRLPICIVYNLMIYEIRRRLPTIVMNNLTHI